MALWRKLDPESVYFVAVEGRERKKHCDCRILQLRSIETCAGTKAVRPDEEQTLSLALWQMIEKSSEGA